MDEGRKLIREFLIILQTYKSSGSVDRAQKFYEHYSKVEGEFLTMRTIVNDKKKPRRVELNNNLIRYNENSIEPIIYPETFEGIIHSFADRYPCTLKLVDQVMAVWDEHREDLRVPL
jgi:dipeptidyl-peptidase-3